MIVCIHYTANPCLYSDVTVYVVNALILLNTLMLARVM